MSASNGSLRSFGSKKSNNSTDKSASYIDAESTTDYHALADDNSPTRQAMAKQAASTILEMTAISNPAVSSFFNNQSASVRQRNNTTGSCSSSLASTHSVKMAPTPIVEASTKFLQVNGCISGREVAECILPRFKDLLSTIPKDSSRDALASIDGRKAISHQQIHKFLSDIGTILHDHVHIGRGHRVAVVLPNGSELALAILAITCWASCVPLNAFAAAAELQSDLEKCGAHCIIALDPARTGSGSEIEQLASSMSIPFCGLVPDSDYAGLFELIPPANLPRCVSVVEKREEKLTTKGKTDGRIPFTSMTEIAVVERTPSIDPGLQKRQYFRRGQARVKKDPPTADEEDQSKSSDGGKIQNTIPIQITVENDRDDEDIELGTQPSKELSVVDTPQEKSIGTVNEMNMPNQHDDEVLVLFTSGTTGGKKLVPHLLADVIVATACISVSWQLTPQDTNCNLMPLFHVGGIIRQVFSPVLSGGCVICCPSFDPLTFWQLMMKDKDTNKPSFTWYYAAPTMHQLILQTGRMEGHIPDYRNRDKDGNPVLSNNSPSSSSASKPRLRMIANAAGGLLPSLARELRQAFGANVLPSYGMTECMPITSPPATYQLEKPGTSGVAVGPDLAILNTHTLEPLQTGKEGAICVRHEPCFRGYGMIIGDNNETEKPVTFLKKPDGECSGWFDTGDLGYMDSDGYLYITGRSKEVINRGGEIISPMEVEEALVEHPDIEACAAFSTAHSVLQEIVGIVIVTKANRPKLDLPSLHEYLGSGRLAAPKWPQCLVHMDGGLPKSFTNKLLRVKLGKRLSLPELNDNMYPIERTFQATCPPQGTAVSVAIPCNRVSANPTLVQQTLRSKLITDEQTQELIVVCHPFKIGALVAYVCNIDRIKVIEIAKAEIDAFLVPTHVCNLISPLDSSPEALDDLPPPQPSDAIGSILQEEQSRGLGPSDPLVTEVQEMMQLMLDLDCLPAPGTSFFNLGGSSMLASQLASKVRKMYNVSFGGAEVFHHSTCLAIAAVIRERQLGDDNGASEGHQSVAGSNAASMAASSLFSRKLDLSKTPFEHSRLEVQPGYFTLLVQLAPLFIIYPVYQLTRLFLFFVSLILVLNKTSEINAILGFVFTLVAFHFTWVIVTPLVFVVCKWIIIGKYQQGRFPIWGSYYLRWWIVDILRKLIGRGIWGSSDAYLTMYYRMLGANIGEGVRLSAKAEIAEYDLVTIGNGAAIEISTVRAFGIDNGAMILGPVSVGDNASVGARSVVAPFTSIPDNAHLGPVSASYEISAVADTGNDAKHVQFNRRAMPQANVFSHTFVIGPILFLVNSFSHVPSILVLWWMLTRPWNYDQPFQSTGHMLQWLCDPKRLPYFIGIRVARSLLAPFFYMFLALIVKWCVIGRFREGPRDTNSQWQLIRHELAQQLFTREAVQNVTELVGRHYELVSVLYRMLGAKVGKRVFWPGRQPIFTGEYDLLEIGDDCVFGSRTALFCTTMTSCEKITLCAGSNVSDNSVVLPGSIIGKGAVLGSNTICPAGRYLPEGSVWLGCRGGQPILLEKGTEEYEGPLFSVDIKPERIQMKGDESTLRPFGKAFYNREATYFVYPLPFIILYTVVNRILVAALKTFPLIAALHGAAGFYYGWEFPREYLKFDVPVLELYPVLLAFFMVAHFFHSLIWLATEIFAKWFFIGQRKEGRYNYDTSTYAQNWELYQITTKVRDLGRLNFLDFISGTPYLVSYFGLLGGKIGNDCCLYPAGGDPYMPEPDLVEIGDRCVIDCAAVVCHLNTRGNFELAKIVLEHNVTLRTRARIQQAVVMETGSMLLEKSLAMTGEIIEADSVWFGGPAARLLSYDCSSISSRPSGGASVAGSHQDPSAYV